MTMKRLLFAGLFFSVLMNGFLVAHAEEAIAGSVYDESKETEILQKARRRNYPGGRDEGDLSVQSQLTAPTRKITPQMESGGGESAADD